MAPTLKRRLMLGFSHTHGALYRLAKGRVPWAKDLLLLTSTGRKSGKSRSTPLIYVRDGDRYVVVASNGGSDLHPTWWLNLQANPDAAIEIRGKRTNVSATQADDADRDRLWPEFVKIYANYDKYAAGTDRAIPLIFLEAVTSGA
jgi:deazaflavin-dependent oxidoreductase (nitroreductase family)